MTEADAGSVAIAALAVRSRLATGKKIAKTSFFGRHHQKSALKKDWIPGVAREFPK
jgi:hypothetical protein